MRNPHYVEQIITELMDFDHNKEIMEEVIDCYKGKKVTNIEKLRDI